jgi:hypothetical protein
MKRLQSLGLLAIVALVARSATAQQQQEPTLLTVSPAPEPVPALRFTLLPRPGELVPENAAVYYHRAMQLLQQASVPPEPRPEGWKSLATRIYECSTDDDSDAAFPFETARELLALDTTRLILDELQRAARCASADWGLHNRPHQITLLLPEIQETRNLGRLLVTQARVDLHDGRPEAALDRLRQGYALARHLGTDSTLMIQTLVGIAIAGHMNHWAERLIQAPSAPNLYWMLAGRPRPFVSMARGIEGEREILESELPALRTIDQRTWSLDESQSFADDLVRVMPIIGAPASPADRAGVAALVALAYPRARQALIDAGRTPEQVDAMPTLQAAAIDAYHRFLRYRDDVGKSALLPYWQSYQLAGAVEQRMSRDMSQKLQDPLATVFQLLLPATRAAIMAEVRTERQFDALQTVEALRLYAAGHDGKLPATLADLDALAPAPIDTATGQPFVYSRESDTVAHLSAPNIPGGPDHPAYRINFRIELRPAATTPKTETTQP